MPALPPVGVSRASHVGVRSVLTYGIVLCATLGALALSTAIAPQLIHVPFVFCYVVVALAALYGGLGPALVATAVGIVGVSYLILPPTHSIRIERPADMLSIIAFTVVSVAISSLTNSLRVALQRAGRLALASEAQALALGAANADMQRASLALEEERCRADAARLAAEAASASKSRFLGMIGHEIRTPLNASLGYADLLAADVAGPLTEQQRTYIRCIIDASRHLASLVGDILDAVKMESGRLAVGRAVGNLCGPVAQTVALASPHADARGVTLAYTGDGSAMYVGDEDRVRQVLLNLIWNAIKFTERGGRVDVACSTTDQAAPEAHLHGGRPWAYARVDDTGCGIAPDQIEAVFAPFVQGETTLARRSEGAGLGLAISRQLARLMGGDVSARSVLGNGSTFTLWLPTPKDAASGTPTSDAANRLY